MLCTHVSFQQVIIRSFFFSNFKIYVVTAVLLVFSVALRGGPSFSRMITSILRGGRGLKNDDKYHNILMIQINFMYCCKKKYDLNRKGRVRKL